MRKIDWWRCAALPSPWAARASAQLITLFALGRGRPARARLYLDLQHSQARVARLILGQIIIPEQCSTSDRCNLVISAGERFFFQRALSVAIASKHNCCCCCRSPGEIKRNASRYRRGCRLQFEFAEVMRRDRAQEQNRLRDFLCLRVFEFEPARGNEAWSWMWGAYANDERFFFKWVYKRRSIFYFLRWFPAPLKVREIWGLRRYTLRRERISSYSRLVNENALL